LTIIPFSFQNLYASQPNQGSIAGAQFSKKKAATKIILQADFSLSEKHLETVWLLILHAIPCEIFCSSGNNSDLAYTFGKYGHREQDL
jgi:iron complex outermembrane receptor protein